MTRFGRIFKESVYASYPALDGLWRAMAERADFFSRPDEAREELLRASIAQYVATVPYYARNPAYHRDVATIADLASLPLLEYPQIAADPAAFSSRERAPQFFIFSGGTTTGAPKLFPRAFSEFAAMTLWEMAALQRGYAGADRIAKLDIVDVEHGATRPLFEMASDIDHTTLPMTEAVHYVLAARFMPAFLRQGEADITRVVEGRWLTIRALTAWALENDVSFRALGVDEVILGGWVITERWKQLIEEVWGVRPTELYGLTEFHQGHSRRRPGQSGYHFRSTVVPELVDPVTLQPARGDVGELVLTHLAPYGEVQPIIRYRTYDICRRVRNDRGAGDDGYVVLGRQHQMLYEDGEPVFSAMALVETLDGLGFVTYDNENANLSGLRTDQMGLPNFECTIDAEAGRAHVTVPVRFPVSAVTRDETRTLRDRIYERLAERNPEVSRLVSQGRLQLTFTT